MAGSTLPNTSIVRTLRSHDILLFQVEVIELSIEISNQIWQGARTVSAVSFTSLFPRWDHQRAARQGVLGDGEMSRIDLRPGDLHNPKDVAVRTVFQPARAIRIIERARVPYSNILVALQNFRNGTDRLDCQAALRSLVSARVRDVAVLEKAQHVLPPPLPVKIRFVILVQQDEDDP